MSRATALVGALLLCALGARTADAAASHPCGATPAADCLVDHALARIDAGDGAAALALLKDRRDAAAADPRYALALTRAYLAVDNRIWAQRTLARALARDPGDCEARAWLVWLLVSGAELDAARDQLATPPCPTSPPTRARWDLLRSFVERERGDGDAARRALADARDAPVVFAEDDGLLTHLERTLWPGREPPLFTQAELKLGWSTEPRLGSPVDPRAEEGGGTEEAAGVVGELNLLARLGYRALPWLLPFAQVEGRAALFSSDPAYDLSHVRPGVSAGLAFALGPAVTLRAAWRFDALLLAGGDTFGAGPIWYSRGNVGELDLGLGSSFTVMASGGRRVYRPQGRSRWEARLRFGGGGRLGSRVFLLGTLSGEVNRARNPAYHQWGLTGLAEMAVDVGGGWSTRARMSVGVDWYPDSANAPEFGTGDDPRRDILLRPALAVWSPPVGGVRFALAYEPSWQVSTASAYEFVDHRALLHVRWTLHGDPWRPDTVAPSDHVPLPHGFAAGPTGESLRDRIRELLRQDEETQRSSTCVD